MAARRSVDLTPQVAGQQAGSRRPGEVHSCTRMVPRRIRVLALLLLLLLLLLPGAPTGIGHGWQILNARLTHGGGDRKR